MQDTGENQSHVLPSKEKMMTEITYDEVYKSFLKTFRSLALHKHRYDVFRDFVFMSATSLRNAMNQDEELEAEYLKTINSYDKSDRDQFPILLAKLIELLEFEPKDVLGTLFMELELGSKDKGQFFTPPQISEFMADITYGEDLEKIDKPFLTLSDPCCGAGGMILAFVKIMISHKHNPAEKIWVECIDVDRNVALMCYIQLALWNVPAVIIVGNSLSLQYREYWYTPAHILGNWSYKLEREQQPSTSTEEKKSAVIPDKIFKNSRQFDFGF